MDSNLSKQIVQRIKAGLSKIYFGTSWPGVDAAEAAAGNEAGATTDAAEATAGAFVAAPNTPAEGFE
ncbi:protein of unknown function [Paraburkholderia kururiensis]